ISTEETSISDCSGDRERIWIVISTERSAGKMAFFQRRENRKTDIGNRPKISEPRDRRQDFRPELDKQKSCRVDRHGCGLDICRVSATVEVIEALG
ncbi:unnamed protein product, partial [Heterotrigona itama]